jgi:ADP-ribosyl-[dinitrogen reductase] hydrolase
MPANDPIGLISRQRGCLLGLACGDAIGTTVEFSPRGTFRPVTDMVGGGPFSLPAGAWTDDTSMALCLATSLVEQGRFDAADQMQRYCRWWQEGYLSSTGRCFDIGLTTRAALATFQQSGDPFAGSTDPWLAGNGSLMRLAPVPMFFYPDVNAARRWSGESSRSTHAAAECIEACRLFAAMICAALAGKSKAEILFSHVADSFQCPKVRAIALGAYREKSIDEIAGTGYVIKCLEASTWCFLQTDSFRDAVLMAVNLGDDADTTGAVCGQLAGAYYGEKGIPAEWLTRLTMVDQIRRLADRLAAHQPTI